MATVKNEEVLHVAGFVLDSYKRDIDDFTAFSSNFNEAFTTDFETKVTGLKDMMEPLALTNALTATTKSLYELFTHAADEINRLEGFIAFATKNLVSNPGDFNLHTVRKHINRRHVEGFTLSISVTLDTIAKNEAPLEGGGMPKTFAKEITDLRDKITATNLEQKHKLDERRDLVVKNKTQIEELMDIVSLVNKFGKIIYKRSNPEKRKDYTINNLVYRNKQESK
ncbi:hypothetical protein [Williamwhitmania taraxaci]|uniref:Uncharacterized protein n=1 Tax=Williamwhitmania taraxaci TaxID=1640674 RepID=A0A1G6J4Y5_9BACT|nr:hypothetical protein [Williamwhitmania taraxaci]SDC13717.1 hypothetical protein SAMN05216323_101844 [Williamwhitmania taraxaci]